jgi:hypothetical protein
LLLSPLLPACSPSPLAVKRLLKKPLRPLKLLLKKLLRPLTPWRLLLTPLLRLLTPLLLRLLTLPLLRLLTPLLLRPKKPRSNSWRLHGRRKMGGQPSGWPPFSLSI